MITFTVDDELFLRIVQDEDAEPLFNLMHANREHLRRWLPWVDANSSVEHTRMFIKNTKEQRRSNLGFQAGIWFRGTLAGVIGYHPIDWLNKSVELGYWIGAEFQGKGIVTRSCRYLVDYAFRELRLHRVQIRCAVGNERSCAIIERLGFIREGTARGAEFLYGRYVDLIVFGLTAEEWNALDAVRAGNAAERL